MRVRALAAGCIGRTKTTFTVRANTANSKDYLTSVPPRRCSTGRFRGHGLGGRHRGIAATDYSLVVEQCDACIREECMRRDGLVERVVTCVVARKRRRGCALAEASARRNVKVHCLQSRSVVRLLWQSCNTRCTDLEEIVPNRADNANP